MGKSPLRNVEEQLCDKTDPDFGRKCAMLLLGMHRWVNQQKTNVTFTPDGNITYQIEINATLDPDKYLYWGHDESERAYVAVPVYYMNNGTHMNRNITDGNGTPLTTAGMSEVKIMVWEAFKYCWGQISCRRDLEKTIFDQLRQNRQTEYIKAAKKYITAIKKCIAKTSEQNNYNLPKFKEDDIPDFLDSEPAEELFRSLIEKFTSVNPNDRLPLEEQREKQHWLSERLIELAHELNKEWFDTFDQDVSSHPFKDWECEFLLEIHQYIKDHKDLRLPKSKKGSADAKALLAALLLMSNLCEQYPLVVFLPLDDIQQKMTFTIQFDASYCSGIPEPRKIKIFVGLQQSLERSAKESTRFRKPLTCLANLLDGLQTFLNGTTISFLLDSLSFLIGPLSFLLGPLRLEDTVNLSFQSFAARASHLEVTSIEHTDVTDVRGITINRQSRDSAAPLEEETKQEKTQKEANEEKKQRDKEGGNPNKIRIQSVAGRIHCIQDMTKLQPITRICMTMLPDLNTLHYSLLWSALLAALSGVDMLALTNIYPLTNLFSGDNLIAGLSMVFTLWLAKTLSGINNSLSDHVRKKLDDTISKSLIWYSISYAMVFINLGIRNDTDRPPTTYVLPQPWSEVVQYTTLVVAMVTGILSLVIFIKSIIWYSHRRNVNAHGTNTFINDGIRPVSYVTVDHDDFDRMGILEKAPLSTLAEYPSIGSFINYSGYLNTFINEHWSAVPSCQKHDGKDGKEAKEQTA